MSDKTNHFNAINRRILWLTDRIAWCKVNDKPSLLYFKEREALIWVTDKVKELSTRLFNITNTLSDDITPEQEVAILRSKIESLEFGLTRLTEDLKVERTRRKKAEFDVNQLKAKLPARRERKGKVKL